MQTIKKLRKEKDDNKKRLETGEKKTEKPHKRRQKS